MNKVIIGVIVGAVLGFIDGATAWFTPEVRNQMLGIVIGSTVKGVLAGVAAGWYARRVQSVPKGIAFGFIVGLILAFIVSALNQPHYWFEIMIPGSILGAVIGWATQRYGRPATSSARRSAAAALVVALMLTGANAYADPNHDHGVAKPGATANTAFEKLKALAGTWSANTVTKDGELTTVEYRVTAGGSVVMETMFAGQPHEMINMYSLDGDSILATHYCSGQNVPVLKLNTQKSTADKLVFDFVSVSGANRKGYINGVQLHFGADGKVEEVWRTTESDPYVRLFLNTRK